jgi:hypothetical protein
MTAKEVKFSPYRIKKVIIEVKYPANLLHAARVYEVLNDYVSVFDSTTVVNTSATQPAVRLVSEKIYTILFVEWNRMVMTIENARNIDDTIAIVAKYLNPLPAKFGIKLFSRIGIRTMYLLPFSDDFDALVSWFNTRVYRDIRQFAPIGEVVDVGIVLTAKDDRFKMNIGFGPFERNEIREKISEFKKYEDDVPSALCLDLDMYLDAKADYKISAVVEEALNSSRLKLNKFIEGFIRG